jgi:hypothetical protein
MTALTLIPIAYLRCGRSSPEDDNWGRERAAIELDEFLPNGDIRQPDGRAN